MIPNVRRMFVPDPGNIFFDIDLSSADLRIVAWESNCKVLKQWLNEGKDPYTMVAREYYKEPDMPKSDPRRQRFKSLCHATHYLGIAKNIAGNSNIGLTAREVERVQAWYFELCPEIKAWQQKIIEQIKSTMTVSNAFGYRYTFLSRLENDTFNKAVAWIPQSTVGILINHALVEITRSLPEVQLLLQVHDSLAGQYPINMPELRESIIRASEIVIPYADPLVIPVGIKTSTKSWGHCE
jgi:DNA polymerase I